MDDEVREQAVNLLEELVLDSGEAVSYRRLATSLCVHVNRSKALLQDFVEKYEEARGLKTSFLVCGSTGDGGARMILSSRDELERARASLNPILFEHVYAVACSSTALEELLVTAESGGFEEFTPTIGAISNLLCAKRSQDETGSSERNYNIGLTNDVKVIDNVANKSNCKVKNEENDLNKTVTLPFVDSNRITHTNSSSVVKKVKSSTKITGTGNISTFLNKTNGLPAVKKTIKVEEKSVDNENESENHVKDSSSIKSKRDASPENKKKQVNSDKTEKEVPKKKELTTSVKSGTTESKKKKETVKARKNTKVDKKRKRVLCLSDSEDSEKDDPFEEPSNSCEAVESDDEIIPPTPNADVVKITSGIMNPKKRRKIVDKMYTTADGYMITKKEEVLESCSEDDIDMKENVIDTKVKEIVVEKKTPAMTPKTKKVPSPPKGKQSSITNFFKKKP